MDQLRKDLEVLQALKSATSWSDLYNKLEGGDDLDPIDEAIIEAGMVTHPVDGEDILATYPDLSYMPDTYMGADTEAEMI